LAAVAVLAAALLLSAVPGAGAAQGTSVLHQIGYSVRATGLATDPDGKLWFGGYRAALNNQYSLAGWLGDDGAVAEFPLSSGGYEEGAEIAFDGAGNLWFTDIPGNSVGRVAADGEVTKFPLPTADAKPGVIIDGPAGDMWFVEEAAAKVGRVTPGGVVSEYALPSGAWPLGIAEGPDGALWVTESGRSRIARLAPESGAITHFPLPEPGIPRAIVSGPGDRLWFSDESKPAVGRIAPGGEVEMLPVSSDFGTRELIVGSDNNLWFTTASAIGSISPDGELGEPACVNSSCSFPPISLARGADGEIWFGAADRLVPDGGGGAQIGTVFEPGVIGRFEPPPVSVRLGKRATKVNDGLITVALSCHGGTAGEAGRGWLRLTTKVGGRTVRLDQHRYRIEPTTGRRLPLLLGGLGMRQLVKRKRIAVRVIVTLADGRGVARRFVLQARHRR